MSQLDQYEMDRRPPSTRPPTSESSTVANLMPQTETVRIPVNNLAAEMKLKRGLGARQVSTTAVFPDVWNYITLIWQISMMALGGAYGNSTCLCQLSVSGVHSV